MALGNLARACGNPTPPGAKLVAYFTYISELTAWPQTAAELGGTDPGDTKLLDEPFAFVTTVGLGYWRQVTGILVDTAQVTNTLEGEVGGQMFRQRYTFFFPSNNEITLEWMDGLVAASGCLIWLIPTKDGKYHTLGDRENGCYVEVVEGGSGEARVGYTVTIFASTGYTTYLYDADTHGIDVTPNTV